MSTFKKLIRVCEWARVEHGLSRSQRESVNRAAMAWRTLNHLPTSPLAFEGPDGEQLSTRQYVGVVEIEDVVIEIYPKLDRALLDGHTNDNVPDGLQVGSVMRSLLWMLEVSEHRELSEASTANLAESPTSFFDLFAYLLAKNLLPELQRGVPHAYVTFGDDLRAVRGRIRLLDQVTRNWNRVDRLSCTWDEFTENTPINRLLNSACKFLSERVADAETTRLLFGCEALLTDVEHISPVTALREVRDVRFDRAVERFRIPFNLARRLLSGIGHNLGVGTEETFVFLLNMNSVFESYVHAVLESHFNTSVECQKRVGSLLRVPKAGIAQYADYFWFDSERTWVGDAKYKHLAKGQQRALRFSDLVDTEDMSETVERAAGRLLEPNDVRQLTVYAELAFRNQGLNIPAELMLLYPFVGRREDCIPDHVAAWNGCTLWLMPVQVTIQESAGAAIQIPYLLGSERIRSQYERWNPCTSK